MLKNTGFKLSINVDLTGPKSCSGVEHTCPKPRSSVENTGPISFVVVLAHENVLLMFQLCGTTCVFCRGGRGCMRDGAVCRSVTYGSTDRRIQRHSNLVIYWYLQDNTQKPNINCYIFS